MSLDVYLNIEGMQVSWTPIEPKILVREGGQIKEITREQWDEAHPGQEPLTVEPEDTGVVYHANITHNLNTMAGEAGIYQHLWRPDEISIETASQLIEPLDKALTLLKSNPERFRSFNPKNGWGSYELLVSFVRNYLFACRYYPQAKISVSR